MLYRYLAQAPPDKPALITPMGVYTYAQLCHIIPRDATTLHQWGIRAGDVVALLAPNHPTSVRLIVALWELGAIALPLNTRLTADEIRYQLGLTGATHLIHADDMPPPTTDLPTYRFDQLTATHQAVLPTAHIHHPSDVALIMFTSGTSGKPKGAMLTHGNLLANAVASHERLAMTRDDNWLCVLPLYHIGGFAIIMRCLMLGATVTLLPRFDADAVHEALVTHPITLVSLVPTMLYRLLERDVRRWQPTLRLILLGGAAADAHLMRRCADLRLPIATTYGLTEATSQVCTAPPDVAYRKPASVGKPLSGIAIRIVDADGATCPTGTIGEIAVRGATVMAGYYRDATATDRALRQGELFTGDMGYLDAEGDLFVVQRRSDLIVTGGENVYPAEVEAVLRGCAGVVDVAVVGIPDREWGQVVGCVLVGDVDVATVQAYARRHLAGYKLPRRWLVVEALPLTSTGKVDRAAVGALLAEKTG